jgi:hypothetical protein
MRKRVLVGIFATVLAVLFAFNTVPAAFAVNAHTEIWQGTYSNALATYDYYLALSTGGYYKWVIVRIRLVSINNPNYNTNCLWADAYLGPPYYEDQRHDEPTYVGDWEWASMANGLSGTKFARGIVGYFTIGGYQAQMESRWEAYLYDNGTIQTTFQANRMMGP